MRSVSFAEAELGSSRSDEYLERVATLSETLMALPVPLLSAPLLYLDVARLLGAYGSRVRR